MRCGCLALILVAAFVTVDNPNSAQIAGHLVVAAKGGTNCASYCVEYMRGLIACIAILLVLTAAYQAAAIPNGTSYDWEGAYVGAELGYATGASNFSTTGAEGSRVSGSFDMFREFDAFAGTGSYFAGLVAGYNYVFPSRLLLGVEGDLLFPNDISGSKAVSSVSAGEASYSDTVLMSGAARGRLGYAFQSWLLYGTAGIAFSRDQINRTQINGTSGTTVAGDVDTELLTRWGVTIGGVSR